jgi:hypothetical protein
MGRREEGFTLSHRGACPKDSRGGRAVIHLKLARAVTLTVILLAAASISCGGCTEPKGGVGSTTDLDFILLPASSTGEEGVRWGFVDDQGNWVIQPTYEDVNRFHEGLAAVKQDRAWGYIDASGVYVIEPRFSEAHSFSDGLARVATGPGPHPEDHYLITASGYGFVDKKGRMVVGAAWDDAGDFSEGLAPVMRDGLCGFIDRSGKLVIPLQFDNLVSFSEGLACAAVDDSWGFVDRNGKWAISPSYLGSPTMPCVLEEMYGLPVGRFKDGLAPVSVHLDARGGMGGGRWCAYINQSGERAFEQVFYRGAEFKEGLAAVQTDGDAGYSWGFINPAGKYVVVPRFDLAGPGNGNDMYLLDVGGFQEGLSAVAVDGLVGYIDKTGTVVIEPEYYFGGCFFEGFAYVAKGDGRGKDDLVWTYIDRDGQAVY